MQLTILGLFQEKDHRPFECLTCKRRCQQGLTGGHAATKQSELLEADGVKNSINTIAAVVIRAKPDDAGGIDDGVLCEGGGVQEMEDGSAVNGGKPARAIADHDLLHGVDPEFLAHVGFLACA